MRRPSAMESGEAPVKKRERYHERTREKRRHGRRGGGGWHLGRGGLGGGSGWLAAVEFGGDEGGLVWLEKFRRDFGFGEDPEVGDSVAAAGTNPLDFRVGYYL